LPAIFGIPCLIDALFQYFNFPWHSPFATSPGFLFIKTLVISDKEPISLQHYLFITNNICNNCISKKWTWTYTDFVVSGGGGVLEICLTKRILYCKELLWGLNKKSYKVTSKKKKINYRKMLIEKE
jgi:hypothetical protein